MRLFRELWSTSSRGTGLVVALILLSAAGQTGALALAGPVLVDRSVLVFALLVVALAASVLGEVVMDLVMARLTADWAAAIRRRLCSVAFGQSLQRLENMPVGELLDRIDADVDQVGWDLRGICVRMPLSIAVASLSVVSAFFVWWPAALAMVLVSILLVVNLRRPTSRLAPLRIAEEAAWSDLAAVMEEAIHGQDDVRTSLAAPYVRRLYAQRAAVVLRNGRQLWRATSRITLAAGAMTRLLIVTFVLTGALALAGHIDGARLTSVWLLAVGLGSAMENLTRMVPKLQNTLGTWGRVQLLLGVPQEPVDGGVPEFGDVRVEHLTFRYADVEPNRPPALNDLSLTLRRGRSYALIGRTGSGKSTLARVLTRAVDVPRGTVFLAGKDINDLDVERLRTFTATVPQRTEILDGTVAENIALFDPDLLPRADAALAELGLSSWVDSLPDGLETKLGENGHKLSAGQEQLIAFARVLARDPRIVILDEATARMDPVTESWVHRATDRLLDGRIGLIVAHRLSSVQHCDEVVVLGDGKLLETGPLRASQRFADLLASSDLLPATADGPDPSPVDTTTTSESLANTLPPAEPPLLPREPAPRTFRQLVRLATNDPRFGLVAVCLFVVQSLLGLDGSIIPLLWTHVVDGLGNPIWPAIAIAVALVVSTPTLYYTNVWYMEWWTRQMLRISLRLVHGQIGPRRVSEYSPAEVVAQAGSTQRVVMLVDHFIDHAVSVVILFVMTIASRSLIPPLFFAGTMVIAGLAATLFGPWLERVAQQTLAARGTFATALVSALSAARTIKLAGATRPVLNHLARLDAVRSAHQRREIAMSVWSNAPTVLLTGLLSIAAWALYMSGYLSAAATLIAVATLSRARFFAWSTATLVTQSPAARVWTRRTVAMAGTSDYAAAVPGVDIATGDAPAPPIAPRTPLDRLELIGFTAVHEDGTVGAKDIDLTVDRGQMVLVVGPVGSGKSSLLRALAGIVHHTGSLRWNGRPVDEPELFLRPNQVGYVAQLPRMLSGTVAENIQLGHAFDLAEAISTAQLEHDLSEEGAGLELMIGHKGNHLSGGQLQRVALARALAHRTELLIADDVSSALDVTTELELWRALRDNGVTVVGSTSKRAALNQADRVVVLIGGRLEAQGTWAELEGRWGHLAA